MIKRMHINLTHPSKEELIRMLGAFGVGTAAILAASALRCASCLRLRKLTRRKPAAVPKYLFIGVFGERLMGDIFFGYTVAGRKIMFLGVICLSSLLHIVRL